MIIFSNTSIHMHQIKLRYTVIVLLIVLASCKWANVGRYDPVIDNTVIELQQDLSRFFVQAETQAGTDSFNYANFSQFYEDLRVKSETLRIRSAAINEGSIADGEILLLDENIRKLQQLHKIGIGSNDEVQLLKSAFDRQLTAIMKLHMGLKQRQRKTT